MSHYLLNGILHPCEHLDSCASCRVIGQEDLTLVKSNCVWMFVVLMQQQSSPRTPANVVRTTDVLNPGRVIESFSWFISYKLGADGFDSTAAALEPRTDQIPVREVITGNLKTLCDTTCDSRLLLQVRKRSLVINKADKNKTYVLDGGQTDENKLSCSLKQGYISVSPASFEWPWNLETWRTYNHRALCLFVSSRQMFYSVKTCVDVNTPEPQQYQIKHKSVVLRIRSSAMRLRLLLFLFNSCGTIPATVKWFWRNKKDL